MKIRPNTWDSAIVKSVMLLNEYNLPKDMRGMIVVDIGAHIGSFAVACAKRGAKAIYSFEPDPENYELLQANTEAYRDRVICFNQAVVPDNMDPFIELGVRRLTNHDYGTRNTGHVDVFGSADEGIVSTVNIGSILYATAKIDLLKIDCEGMEWALLADADLSNVAELALEIHDVSTVEHSLMAPYRSVGFMTLAQDLSSRLRKQGFEVALLCENMELGKITAKRVMSIDVNVPDKQPKLLWVGDAGVITGSARVMDSICIRLIKLGWDVSVLGIGYTGDPHKSPYKIYPAVDPNVGGHRNGASRLKEVVGRVQPDIILFQDDSWNVGILTEHMAMNNIWVPAVSYVSIDSENVRRDVAVQLKNLKHIICHTQYGVDQLKLAGYNGPISYVPHGVDTALYTSYDKAEAREGIAAGSRKLEDAFIWGAVAANQGRKRLDLSIAYFAKWWENVGKPQNAYLYIHTNAAGDYDLRQIADFCGVRSQILGTDGGQSLRNDHMPTLYNAFDAMIHTSEGESFGLTALEGMACRIPQISVETGGMPSWAGTAAYWVKPSYYAFTPIRGIGTKRWIASEKDFSAGMQDVYSLEALRENLKLSGRNLAAQLNWDKTATHFDSVLRQILETKRVAYKADTDCLTEFGV